MARKINTRRALRLKSEARQGLAWDICVASAPLAVLALIFAVLSHSHGGF